MAVRLEFFTEDAEEIELAKRYWAMENNGKYIEKVKDLVPFRNLIHAGLVSEYISKFCSAYDENTTCLVCGNAVLIRNRFDPNKQPQRSHEPCQACAEEIKSKDLKIKLAEEEKIQQLIKERSNEICSRKINYNELKDDTCLILIALDALISPSISKSKFNIDKCRNLTPFNPEKYIQHLFEQGAIIDNPYAAKKEAYFLTNDQLDFNFDDLVFSLSEDNDLGLSKQAFEVIKSRNFTDVDSLFNLWLDYASDDVIRYLSNICLDHRLYLDLEQQETIISSIRKGLQNYSVSDLCFIMWKTACDAARNAQHIYSNSEKAAKKIPNNIQKQLEYAYQKGIPEKWKWIRPRNHITGTLGIAFSDYFGIDEFTSGKLVLKRLSLRCGKPSADEDSEQNFLASALLESSTSNQNAANIMEKFADLIRAGLDTKSALKELTQITPK